MTNLYNADTKHLQIADAKQEKQRIIAYQEATVHIPSLRIKIRFLYILYIVHSTDKQYASSSAHPSSCYFYFSLCSLQKEITEDNVPI